MSAVIEGLLMLLHTSYILKLLKMKRPVQDLSYHPEGAGILTYRPPGEELPQHGRTCVRSLVRGCGGEGPVSATDLRT